MAIKVFGPWDEGYVADQYVVKSIYKGEDAFGFKQYDTTYTEIGKLLHAMKYNGHFDTSVQIAELCMPFLSAWLIGKNISAVLPAPPTSDREFQPVYAIAESIARGLKLPYSEGVLSKVGSEQTKNIPKEQRNLAGSIVQNKPARRLCNILLIDDFYSTGSTAGECVNVLRLDPLIDKIYYMAVAKTK